jgi:hypothetical protein
MTLHRISRRFAAALVAGGVVAAVTVPAAQATTHASRSFVLYAKQTHAQFVSHSDDRERGDFKNPFSGADIPTPPNANSGKKGARAGDNALFTLKLYSDTKLTRSVGTATYSCTVNFGQQAVCDGQFQLKNGTMIAMGPADLKSGNLDLPVTGGTGRYAGAHGQLTSRSAGGTRQTTQIIRFELVA